MSLLAVLCSKCGSDEAGPGHCSFCGRCALEVGLLLNGLRGHICPECHGPAIFINTTLPGFSKCANGHQWTVGKGLAK